MAFILKKRKKERKPLSPSSPSLFFLSPVTSLHDLSLSLSLFLPLEFSSLSLQSLLHYSSFFRDCFSTENSVAERREREERHVASPLLFLLSARACARMGKEESLSFPFLFLLFSFSLPLSILSPVLSLSLPLSLSPNRNLLLSFSSSQNFTSFLTL